MTTCEGIRCMSAYIIVTDSNADLVPGFAAENQILELELTYTIDGSTYRCNDPALSRHAFYDMMRAGKMPITAQVNVEEARAQLEEQLKHGNDLLCIMFSSCLLYTSPTKKKRMPIVSRTPNATMNRKSATIETVWIR